MLNDLYQSIDQIGLNTTKLFVAIGVCSLLLVFAIREILAWFLKTSTIAKQFSVISERLESIENKLDKVTESVDFENQLAQTNSQAKNQFEIHH